MQPNFSGLISRQQKLSGNVIAEPFNIVFRLLPTNPGLTENQVHHLVQKGERPRSPSIPIVDYDEGRDVICDGESPETLQFNCSVMAA